VIGVIVVAAGLRVWNLDKNLLIHYDQGRDLLAAKKIWHDHKFTLLGPVADHEGSGIFFGPIYYYLIALPLGISGGNPTVAVGMLIGLELVSMVFFWKGVDQKYGGGIAGVSLVMLATGYGLVSYSRWLSNAMPVVGLGNMLVYFLLVEKWRWWWLTVGVVFAFNPAAGIGIFIFGLFADRQRWRNWWWFWLPAIPQMVFEVRHDFLISRGVVGLMAGRQGNWDWLEVWKAWDRFVVGVVGVPAILAMVVMKFRQKVTWMVLTQLGIMFVFRRVIYEHFFAAIAPGLILAGVVGMMSRRKLIGVGVSVIIITGNLVRVGKFLSKPGLGLTPIGTANLVTLEKRLKVVDFIGKNSMGKSYGWWTYTIPYYHNEVWEYLLWWRGVDVPRERGELFFAVYENDWNNPERQKEWFDELDKMSVVVDRLEVEDMGVEMRDIIDE
jgi:hypothetical protein